MGYFKSKGLEMRNSDYEDAQQMNLAAGECLKRDDFAGALENFCKALELLSEGKVEAKARLYSNMGHAQVGLRRYDDALSSFRNAAEIFEQLGDNIGRGEQLGNIGSVYRDIEKWGASLDSYFKALETFQEVDHAGGVADQYSNIGYAYSRQGELKNAFHFFEKAKALYDELREEGKSQLCDQNIRALKPYVKE
jgi:tetratricopeptide (TPR) repeat protein